MYKMSTDLSRSDDELLDSQFPEGIRTDKMSTGLSGLNEILDGGFPMETIVLISGGAGTGKTLVGLNFLLDGASKGERCCYVSLNEDKNELIRACNGIESLKKINDYIDMNLIIEPVTMGKRMPVDYFTKIFASYP